MTDREVVEQAIAAGTPWIENETTAVFAYRGDADRVRVVGDMTEWVGEIELERLNQSDLFLARVELPSDARIEYTLAVDDAEPGPDPSCPYRVLNGLGAHSELAMPGYRYPEVFASIRDGTPGSFDGVCEHVISGGALGKPKQIHVYLPPDYGENRETRYATVYILDGSDYIEFAHTPAVLNRLIGSGSIDPVIAVFVSPPNRHLPDEPNRVTEYGLNPDFAEWMAHTLVPWVDDRYNTVRNPDSRLVAGDSYAGVGSVFVAFERPDVFGLAYSQSGYLSLEGDRMIHRFAADASRPIRLFVDVGVYEHAVGKGWLPDDETDFTSANRRFAGVLSKRGYDFMYAEYPEGHTWGNWRRHLIDGLKNFFAKT